MVETEEVDVKALDDVNNFIMRTSASVGPYSFVDSRQPMDVKCLPPVHLSNDQLLKPLPKTKE